MENLRDVFNSYKVETVPAKNLVIDIDGIECYGLWGFVKKISLQDKIIYKGIGKSIFVDKNHDLSYYIYENDWKNSINYNVFPGTFGYEWGGYGIETGTTAADIGTGLSNTNFLIEMDLQPKIEGWYVVWDKIKEFRTFHSNNWFLPSKDELSLIYKARLNLNNLSSSIDPYYWSSSERSSTSVWCHTFYDGSQLGSGKLDRNTRTRLCVQY